MASKDPKVLERMEVGDVVLTEFDNGIFHYEDNIARGLFSQEEIDKRNKLYIEQNEAALARIEADGYIKVPVFTRDNYYEDYEAYAWVHPDFTPSCSEGYEDKYDMSYNIYIPSYKRAKGTATIEMLKEHGFDNYYLAINPDQYLDYVQYHEPRHIIIRDIAFRYDHMVDMHSSVKSPYSMHGHSVVVNFLLNFSRSMGERRFWTMDDDIINMAMKAHKGANSAPADVPYNKENYYRCSNIKPKYGFDFKEFLSDMEEVGKKARNAGFIGLEKFGLVFQLPVIWKLGTRVYTFYLTDNENQVKHIGQHNNDVITSLELGKSGFVNMLFEGICYNSAGTQVGTGGQVEVYQTFGTLNKGTVLARAQPNYARIAVNYNRIHHNVNYNFYNKQRLVGAVKQKADK